MWEILSKAIVSLQCLFQVNGICLKVGFKMPRILGHKKTPNGYQTIGGIKPMKNKTEAWVGRALSSKYSNLSALRKV